jgi:hypothetical protein
MGRRNTTRPRRGPRPRQVIVDEAQTGTCTRLAHAAFAGERIDVTDRLHPGDVVLLDGRPGVVGGWQFIPGIGWRLDLIGPDGRPLRPRHILPSGMPVPYHCTHQLPTLAATAAGPPPTL